MSRERAQAVEDEKKDFGVQCSHHLFSSVPHCGVCVSWGYLWGWGSQGRTPYSHLHWSAAETDLWAGRHTGRSDDTHRNFLDMSLKLNYFCIHVNVTPGSLHCTPQLHCHFFDIRCHCDYTREEEMETNHPIKFKNDLLLWDFYTHWNQKSAWGTLNLPAHVLWDVTEIYFVALQMFALHK